ncbi:hypothetical protein [Geodermatophilus sp. DSM 45219]|uniref:hypothetical protein n=1 Tax=Geodermatophilus sp. DSM 45219 TaxID=1881103 RepID=UPI00088B15B3|nr:hypothetical protein [Geodermatophilus sp. DSM 45219]SDO12999.1 hypothetical protein SAMN05428965_2753 [Geodermatophilus sp. DSM 45219]
MGDPCGTANGDLPRLRDSTATIVQAVQESWPGIPTPEDVRRDEDGELLGRVVPTSGGWLAVTTFGAPLGSVSSHDEALATVRVLGLSRLAEPWWVRPLGRFEWHEARLVEVRPDRVRLRWTDPMADQPPSGQWFDLDDLDLALDPPGEPQRHRPGSWSGCRR